MNYGGKYQAPCLRISEPNGEDEWLYESDDIISYLKNLKKIYNLFSQIFKRISIYIIIISEMTSPFMIRV